MKENIFETLVGMFVIFAAVAFVLFMQSNRSFVFTQKQYSIYATFQSIDGIMIGSDVMISGIAIGKVTSVSLDNDYNAHVTLGIHNDIKIPDDSSAIIITSGIIGGKFISITPGVNETYLNNGSSIQKTQSSINIESLVNKLLYFLGGKAS